MKKFFDRFRRKTSNESLVAELWKARNEVQALELALQGIAKMSKESKIDKVRHNWIQRRVARDLNGDSSWTTVKKPTKRG